MRQAGIGGFLLKAMGPVTGSCAHLCNAEHAGCCVSGLMGLQTEGDKGGSGEVS